MNVKLRGVRGYPNSIGQLLASGSTSILSRLDVPAIISALVGRIPGGMQTGAGKTVSHKYAAHDLLQAVLAG